MSTSHTYGPWETADMRGKSRRSTDSVTRRPLNADEQLSYPVDNMSTPRSLLPSHLSSGSSVIRPTSSLAGAMDESAMSVIRTGQSPALVWDGTQIPSAQIHESNYEFVADQNYSPEAGATATGYTSRSASRNDSPESILSVSSSSSRRRFVEQFSGSASEHPSLPVNATASYHHPSPSDEVAYLRDRVRQLEQECRHSKVVIDRLRGNIRPQYSHAFQAGWDARTEARKRIYCSLNRAGNALCAWHDSRRERRAFPPRHAPQGFLNCGCTYEEALFEESLSRHGVGSYHPGEAVRMDPALRNPLLELLRRRYNYKDGDFDFDPINEAWAEGQTSEDWQRKAREGKTKSRA